MGVKKWRFATKSRKTFNLSSFFGGVDYQKDDLATAESVAKDCYNFDTTSGALTTPRGVSLFRNEGTGVRTVAYFRRYKYAGVNDDKYVVVSEDGSVIAYDVNSYSKLITSKKQTVEGLLFTDTPQIVPYHLNSADVLLFCSESNGTFVWDGENPAYKVEDFPHVTSIAVHNERVFVTTYADPKTLWYSNDLDPTDWSISLTGAGFIRMDDERGEVRKVVSFGGYLYVFRESGITRVTANADQASFVVTHLYTTGGKIIPQTITVCGNQIMFCSNEGIFSFNGESVRKILSPLTDIFNYDELMAAGYYEGKYYFSTMLTRFDELIGVENEPDYWRNALFVYDVYSGRYMLYRGVDVKKVIPMPYLDKLLFITEKGQTYYLSYEMGKIGDEVLQARWKMPKSDLGTPGRKTLKRITLFSDNPVTIRVSTEVETREFYVEGSESVIDVLVNMTGVLFSVEFVAKHHASRIINPTLIYY